MSRSTYSRGATKKKVMRKSGKPAALHCMVIPADDETLILPTSVMAEVMEYQRPAPIEAAPPWLLGQTEWEGRQVPIFDFSALINGTDPRVPDRRSHVMVLKSLSDSSRMPYIGLLMNDLPKPLTIKEPDLKETGDDKKSLGVFSRVSFEDGEAIIPDMDRLSHLVRHAVFGALPITQLDR